MTIEDIANLCGLSKSTVSRYLTGGSVSKKSSEKIKKVIEETGFESNIFARRLKTNKSNLIGVLVDGIESSSVTKILTGINTELRSVGYQPFIMIDDYDKDNKIPSMKSLVHQGVDGIIFGTSKITDEYVRFINSLNIPVLILGQKSESLPYCKINDFLGGKIMGEYISSLGTKSVVYMSMPLFDLAAGKERLEGFLSAFSDLSIVHVVETGYDWEDAYRDTKKALEYNPEMIVGASDRISLGVLQYLGNNKINVPGDIKLAGFGNYSFGELPLISLTTIRFDYHSLGSDAAKKIISLINGEETSNQNDSYNLELIIRNSSL